jgi:hypothetical protein
MPAAPGAAYFGPYSDLDPSEDHVDTIRRAKTAIVRDLSLSTTYWVGVLQEASHSRGSTFALPATMLRRAEFDAEPDERAARVRFRVVDEPPDLAW